MGGAQRFIGQRQFGIPAGALPQRHDDLTKMLLHGRKPGNQFGRKNRAGYIGHRQDSSRLGRLRDMIHPKFAGTDEGVYRSAQGQKTACQRCFGKTGQFAQKAAQRLSDKPRPQGYSPRRQCLLAYRATTCAALRNNLRTLTDIQHRDPPGLRRKVPVYKGGREAGISLEWG